MHRNPNSQIKDAADQYCNAALILFGQPNDSGVVLPFLTTAAFSIELYLKSLNAEDLYKAAYEGPNVKYSSEEPKDGIIYSVKAKSAEKGHELIPLFDSLEDRIKTAIEAKFKGSGLSNASVPTFKHLLSRYNNLFVEARYPYEPRYIPDNLPLNYLARLVKFLRDFCEQWYHSYP